MKRFKIIALGASLLFVSSSAMALRQPETSTARSRPAGSVIDVIMQRDAALERDRSKGDHRRDKELRKAAKESDNALRKDAKKREKARREAVRERDKDLRKAERARAKDAREWQKNGRSKR